MNAAETTAGTTLSCDGTLPEFSRRLWRNTHFCRERKIMRLARGVWKILARCRHKKGWSLRRSSALCLLFHLRNNTCNDDTLKRSSAPYGNCTCFWAWASNLPGCTCSRARGSEQPGARAPRPAGHWAQARTRGRLHVHRGLGFQPPGCTCS